ncbi:SPFH domain-containing protein [Streptomyces sp. SM18]|uniref:SPFH domain-containing protein n=2 Tax=unclassified Streptomyces TaxID=2593676 RepID=UPI00215AF559|nr:SPFH domain-containing protein [Streptomyces sp. SM18]
MSTGSAEVPPGEGPAAMAWEVAGGEDPAGSDGSDVSVGAAGAADRCGLVGVVAQDAPGTPDASGGDVPLGGAIPSEDEADEPAVVSAGAGDPAAPGACATAGFRGEPEADLIGPEAAWVEVPADLGPALDAVAGVGRAARAGDSVPVPVVRPLVPDMEDALAGPALEADAQAADLAAGPAADSDVPDDASDDASGEASAAVADQEAVAGAVSPVVDRSSDHDATAGPAARKVHRQAPQEQEAGPHAHQKAAQDTDRAIGRSTDRDVGRDADRDASRDRDRNTDRATDRACGSDFGAALPAGAGAALRAAVRGAGVPVAVSGRPDDADAWWETGRRRPVISNETTTPIPVHLLFRDEGPGSGSGGGPGGLPGPLGFGGGAGDGVRAVRRPPVPRTPRAPQPRSRTRPRTPARPAPAVDPRLAERPGPVLPGWVALLTGVAGVAGGLALLAWHGVLPAALTGRLGLDPRPYASLGAGSWAVLAVLLTVVVFALGGIGRGRVGHACVLTLFGDYRGSVRRTGLLWVSPLLLRRRVDVRLRHWRSEPLPAVDASGTALRVVVLVVWRVEDTARALLGVADHERYLRDQVEAALARVLSQLPADAFHEETRTLRDAEAVGDALTRMLKADCLPVGIEVYSAQPTGIEYAPEVAAAMRRRRIAAIDARHRDRVLTSVVDAVDDTVHRLTSRGIVELDTYEHKALVRDLTVAFYTGRPEHERA